MKAGLHVDRVGLYYAVFDGERQISGVHTGVALAEARMLDIKAARKRAKSTRRRPCMCCGDDFNSEGIHNRLCSTCRSGVPRKTWG